MYREIREQAYRRFEQRRSGGTLELEDWFGAERDLWPATELAENERGFELKVALAGFAPDEVKLTATPHALIVKASRTGSDERRDETVRWSEFRRDDVCRYVPLPSEVDIDKVRADIRHGLLTVTARKAAGKPEKKPRSTRRGGAARKGKPSSQRTK
jgi:HSP20 family molecular chaperone IbpA